MLFFFFFFFFQAEDGIRYRNVTGVQTCALPISLLPALMDVGVTEALAPLGVPDTLRLIVPPLPTTAVEMVLEPLVPCTRLRLPGLAEIVKFGLGAVTVSCTVVGWVTDPSVPVTVSV